MIRERFQTLLESLKTGLYDKDTEIALGLLSALAGESMLLLGPPGVAKSMIARRIRHAFRDARSFEYLMSRFSTPDEIFGPVSITRLKNEDTYERNTRGFLPEADVAFLDEIWKAGPSILNTLLTIINERTFRNGNQEHPVPLKLLMGASNELPAQGEGLEALWDRFLVRIISGCVSREEDFYRILLEESQGREEPDWNQVPTVTPDEYQRWQRDIAHVGIQPAVLQAITLIRKQLRSLHLDAEDESAAKIREVYVSDRRWQHIMHLLRTSAFVHGRPDVSLPDLVILTYCLWSEPDELEAVRRLVVHAILAGARDKVAKLESAIRVSLKRSRIREAMQQAAREDYHRDDNKQLFDGFHYRIDQFGNGHTYIFFVDYKNMKDYSRINAPLEGVVYPDPHHPQRHIIRTMADHLGLSANGVAVQRVKLYRDDDHIYINGVRYPVHLLPPGSVQPPIQGYDETEAVDYDARLESLVDEISSLADSLTLHHLLVFSDDRREVERQVKDINHSIALLRVEVQKMR